MTKDHQPPWTDNVRPASINVNWLRMVTAQLPVKCEACNGAGTRRYPGEHGRVHSCRACHGAGTVMK